MIEINEINSIKVGVNYLIISKSYKFITQAVQKTDFSSVRLKWPVQHEVAIIFDDSFDKIKIFELSDDDTLIIEVLL